MATEKRLIKADPIYNGLLIYMASNAYLNDTALDVLKMVATWVDEEPTVDAVEVVRCKSCQSHEPSIVRGRVWCKTMGRYMPNDGFCSEGGRNNRKEQSE